MALSIQGLGRGKIAVLVGSSVSGVQAPAGAAFGTVSKAWWNCMVAQANDHICFLTENSTEIVDGSSTYYIIDEENYLFTETPPV